MMMTMLFGEVHRPNDGIMLLMKKLYKQKGEGDPFPLTINRVQKTSFLWISLPFLFILHWLDIIFLLQ